jgi:hypothetical protein
MPSLESTTPGDGDRFLQAASNACLGRRSFRGNQFPICLGPAAMRVGNVVSVLFEAQVPFILGPEDAQHRLIGKCYVHELMDGSRV